MHSTRSSLLTALLMLVGFSAQAVDNNQPAPEFSLADSQGQTHQLSQYRGKVVVLEWLNHGCPFVKKHYGSGNMQKLQEKYGSRGVVWLSIISSAPGKEGYSTPEKAIADAKQNGSKAQAVLLDPDGKVGHLYGAKTTPHMFVINERGVLVYQGAIDNRPSTNKADVSGARNYVAQALDQVLGGRKVTKPYTKSYGCSVKYQ